MKIKGFSLQGTLMLMLFASIIMGSLIMMSRINLSIYTHSNLQSLLLSDIESAITLAMESNNEGTISDSIIINHHTPIYYSRFSWGIYDLIQASGKYANNTLTKTGLYCKTLGKDKLPTLHIVGGHNSLSVSGNTLLKGDIYCPNKRVKRAYIEGKNYTGKELYYGSLNDSKKRNFSIDKNEINKRQNAVQKLIAEAEKIPLYALNDSIVNPFTSPTLCIRSDESILVQNFVSGNIIIHSEKEVIIGENAYLENCIISAPSIVIQSLHPISFQAFASNKIVVEEGVNLEFPSILLCTGTQESSIVLKEECRVTGNLIAMKELMTYPETLIHLHKDCNIMGLIHSNGCVQLQGHIDGNVICQKLLLKTNSSTYENVLLDTELLQDSFPEKFPCNYLSGESYSFQKLIEL